jgi:predicted neuraminidase
MKAIEQPAPAGFMVPQKINLVSDQPVLLNSFASNSVTTEIHSASIVELSNGNIRAVWYGGTREGHSDVAIYTNIWNASSKQWEQERVAINLSKTHSGTKRYARKLGNPVITRGSDKNLWLFYVSAVGGWATSSINLVVSKDEGESWGQPLRQLGQQFRDTL